MNDYISLKKRDILRIGIKDENGNIKIDENGNEICIEFDLEDMSLIDRYNDAIKLFQKADRELKDAVLLINKKQDVKDKNEYMSRNEKAKLEALKNYYKTGEEAFNSFLGDGAISKIFGEKRYVTMFHDLTEILKPILPKIKVNFQSIEEKIKTKYTVGNDNVLKDDE